MRILIVEDDKATSELVTHYLQPYSSQMHYAESLEDCFRFCELPGNEFDLIILDLKLPDSTPTNTIDSIGEIKGNQDHAAILIMSGMAPADYYRNTCIEHGADGFLEKNSRFTNTALYAAVFAVLSAKPIEGRTDTFLQNVEFIKTLAAS